MNPKNQNNIYFSIIVPVYNRPQEINELLESLVKQKYQNFEVIIVEDGSKIIAEDVVKNFSDSLDIKYFYKENSGPGLSRNYGMKKAKGDFFIILDSDVLIPDTYLNVINEFLSKKKIDAFGGPDAAHPDFTPLQKAIDFSMTSFLTTGGIRGATEKIEKFQPRSFNMGISPEVFYETQGFSAMRFGEDIDLSIRIHKKGFETALIKDAFVFHKRRNTLKQFFKQIFNSGIARINLFKKYPQSLKIIHFFPTVFMLGFIFSIIFFIKFPYLLFIYLFYLLLIFIFASFQYKYLKTGILSVFTSLIMFFAYGLGFLLGIWKRIILRQNEFYRFKKNFYK